MPIIRKDGLFHQAILVYNDIVVMLNDQALVFVLEEIRPKLNGHPSYGVNSLTLISKRTERVYSSNFASVAR